MTKKGLILLCLSILLMGVLAFIFINFQKRNESVCKSNVADTTMCSTPIVIDNEKYLVDSIKIVNFKELKSSHLYMKHCKFCHGVDGTGEGLKARLDTTLCPYDLSKENKSDNEVYYVILNGKGRMYKQSDLSEDDIWILVLYIKKFKQ